jgi:peptide/nickel transport system permease protein
MALLVYLGRLLASVVPTLLFISIVTFGLMRFVPGDPIDVMYGAERPDPAIRAVVAQKLGLDEPVPAQYARWMGRALVGDFGLSYRSNQPVMSLVAQRLPATLLLVGAAIGLTVLIAIPLGVIAAVRRDSLVDLAGMAAALVSLSVPPFVSGLVLVLLFSIAVHLLPPMGTPAAQTGPLAWLPYLVLPTVTLAATLVGIVLRLTRSTVLEELARDYVVTARAKGLVEQVVLARHVLKNALLPVVTLIGLQLSYLIGGTVIVEIVFAWPGIGSLAVEAILGRDYPIVQALVLLIATLVVAISLLVDLSYSVLDPRVRFA